MHEETIVELIRVETVDKLTSLNEQTAVELKAAHIPLPKDLYFLHHLCVITIMERCRLHIYSYISVGLLEHAYNY